METAIRPGLVTFGNHDILPAAGEATFINASSMAKPFNKKPGNWLRLSSTKRFLQGLGDVKNRPAEELVKIVKTEGEGSYSKGVWIHEEAALEFARWLSPSFAVWNNQRTKELLLTGKTDMLIGNDEANEMASGLLQQKVARVESEMHEQARKAEYANAVLQSRTLIPTNVIAKELGISAIALNKFLSDQKIIYKSDNHWVLFAPYQGKGYTGTKTALYVDSAGRYQSNIHTYWTEKGREFIHMLVTEVKQIA